MTDANNDVGFTLEVDTDLDDEYRESISGTLTVDAENTAGLKWLQAGIIFQYLPEPEVKEVIWSLTLSNASVLGGQTFTHTKTALDDLKTITETLAYEMEAQKGTFDYKPHVSGC